MKTLLRIILCVAMLLEGCYSYAVFDPEGMGRPLPPDNESMRVTLKNGSTIESEALHHVMVNVPSNFIYGVGTSLKRFGGKEQTYVGHIDPSIVDSSKAWEYDGVHYRSFWLKDSTRLNFIEGRYFMVTPDQGSGLWCIGRMSAGRTDSMFAGKIDLADMQVIEVPTISAVKTTILATTIGLVVFGVWLASIGGVKAKAQ